MTTSLREEIEYIIRSNLSRFIEDEPIKISLCSIITTKIIDSIQERIDKKIEYCNREMNDEHTPMISDWDCIDSKKKAFLEMKELLKK